LAKVVPANKTVEQYTAVKGVKWKECTQGARED